MDADSLVWPPSAEDLDAVEVISLDGQPVFLPPASILRGSVSALGHERLAIDLGQGGDVDRLLHQRSPVNHRAGGRGPVPSVDAREGEDLAWPPPDGEEATVSVLDLEAQAAATPLGPPDPPPKPAGEGVSGGRPVSQLATSPAESRDLEASRASSERVPFRRHDDPSTGLFDLDTPPPRSPVVTVLVAFAVVAAIGVGSYSFVRYTGEDATPSPAPSFQGTDRPSTEEGEPGAVAGADGGHVASNPGAPSGSAARASGGSQALDQARQALDRGDLRAALASVPAERAGQPSSPEAQQLITRILRTARDGTAQARREAGATAAGRLSPEFAAATAAESDAVTAWREGRWAAALALFEEATAAYGRLAGSPPATAGASRRAQGT